MYSEVIICEACSHVLLLNGHKVKAVTFQPTPEHTEILLSHGWKQLTAKVRACASDAHDGCTVPSHMRE